MNPIFVRRPSLKVRFSIAIGLSLSLMAFDHFTDTSAIVRTYLTSIISPVLYLADAPQEAIESVALRIKTKESLMEENALLRQFQLEQNEKLQQFALLQQENKKLRALLNSSPRHQSKSMVAEVMAVSKDRFSHQVVVNRGTLDKVYEGQPVIDDLGVVGQLLTPGTTTTHVLLITDSTQAIPIRIERTGVRAIAEGTGNIDRIKLNHIPHSTDIRVGDRLITSGLAQRFPEGYPVGVVTKIIRDEGRQFSTVFARPVAQLDRLKYLLLLWGAVDDIGEAVQIEEEENG
ncbi:rod shape-determining protein MreC [Algicola sagamiensis]|uniref:rod shape-determining protein MreC n=1 Tax=Algicola sagamiensis TaxID=163869 RepID=UPI000A066F05|nr:rod shape-determining protein MreC [Algicola sagamiensis]